MRHLVSAILAVTVATTVPIPVRATAVESETVTPIRVGATARPAATALTQAASDLAARYPGARVVQVTPDEMQHLKETGAARPLAVPESDPNRSIAPPERVQAQPESPRAVMRDRCGRARPVQSTASADAYGPPAHGPYYGNWFTGWGSSSKDSGKDFLIVVALIGIVVVAALVIYSVGYLIDAAACGVDSFVSWEARLNTDAIYDASDTQLRRGSMTGLSAAPAWDIGIGELGLEFEFGRLQAEQVLLKSGRSLGVVAPYATVGPRFRVGGRSFAFILDLAVGGAFDPSVNSLSAIRAGFEFGLGPHLFLDIRGGAVVLGLKALDGFVQPTDDVNYSIGTGLGWRF